MAAPAALPATAVQSLGLSQPNCRRSRSAGTPDYSVVEVIYRQRIEAACAGMTRAKWAALVANRPETVAERAEAL